MCIVLGITGTNWSITIYAIMLPWKGIIIKYQYPKQIKWIPLQNCAPCYTRNVTKISKEEEEVHLLCTTGEEENYTSHQITSKWV